MLLLRAEATEIGGLPASHSYQYGEQVFESVCARLSSEGYRAGRIQFPGD